MAQNKIRLSEANDGKFTPNIKTDFYKHTKSVTEVWLCQRKGVLEKHSLRM